MFVLNGDCENCLTEVPGVDVLLTANSTSILTWYVFFSSPAPQHTLIICLSRVVTDIHRFLRCVDLWAHGSAAFPCTFLLLIEEQIAGRQTERQQWRWQQRGFCQDLGGWQAVQSVSGFFNEDKAQSGVDYQARRKKSPQSSICLDNFFFQGRRTTEKKCKMMPGGKHYHIFLLWPI